MNIYEIYCTVVIHKDPRGGGKITRVTYPELVAETNAMRAKAKVRRVYTANFKGRRGVKITFSKANCIISNR